jgi:hypothetical protein
MSAAITVTPVDDTAVELTESVTLTLAGGANYTVGSPAAATGNITDNDLPTLSIANASVTEGNNGSKTVAVTVTMSAPRSSSVTVAYATLAGTATAGSDYQTTSGTLTFAAGVTSRTINVTVYGDRTNEPNETFQVQLSNPSGATIATGTATVTIVNDDNALIAASAASQPIGAEPISQIDLAAITAEAKNRLAQTGLDAATLAKLEQVSVQIANLDGELLGLEMGDTILIDTDAAGHGWFIDATPGDDVEFTTDDDGELTATAGPAAGRMDLLTVVTHEFGHAVGLDHDESTHDLMAATLTPGTRHLHETFEISFAPTPVAAPPEPDAALASAIAQGQADLMLGDALVGEMARLLASRGLESAAPVRDDSDLWQDFGPPLDESPLEGLLVDFSNKPASDTWETLELFQSDVEDSLADTLPDMDDE